MLGRQVVGYLPAQLVPALTGFAAVYGFTRLATPEAYGRFALVISIATMCQSVLFYWIQVGAAREVERATLDGRLAELQTSVYRSQAVTFGIFVLAFLPAVAAWPLDADLRQALWFAVGVVGLRSLVAVNQAFHRGAFDARRFNLIECTQAIGQLGFGLVLVAATPFGASALLAGAVAGSLVAALPDLGFVARALGGPASRAGMRGLLRFGLPLSISFALNYILATSDRLLVQHYLGSAAVGVYAVAYGLVDRSIGMVFVAVSLAAFPLAIRAFEHEGAAGASRQLRVNGRLLLATAVPVAALLAVLSPQLAAVMVGAAFRSEVASIMPGVAAGALMAGFQVHFFDHAFHLSKRTMLFLLTAGPAALVNLAANLLLLPRIGLIGAVWATLIGYALSLAASILVGARVLRVPLDLRELGRVGLAAAAMVVAVRQLDAAPTLAGLVAGAAFGVAIYAGAAVALDVGGLRGRVLRRRQP